jgi:Mn2+/Fe2+ NRAMP family transporter
VLILLAAVPIAIGMNPLALTNVSMVATAASLPVTVLPLLVLMNDGDILLTHTNGWLSNLALVIIALLSVVLLVAAVPLQILGGS